jgi:23S rRNA pseudouridine1911/1915/1917 synthase
MAERRKLTTSAIDAGLGLAAYVAVRLDLSDDAARALVTAGSVYLDKRRCEQPDHILAAGQQVVVHVDAAAPSGPVPIIVHKDRDVVVVDKPAGMASQAERDSAVGAVDRWLAGQVPGATLVHRLDRDASGVMVFARNDPARKRLAGIFAGGTAERIYRAVVHGHPAADEGVIDAAIGPDPRDRRRMAVGQGRPATSRFRVLRRGGSALAPTALVEVSLVTGRSHQVRVHLAHLGHPLVGDPIYGPADGPALAPRLCLHACRLAWPGGPRGLESAAPALFDELVASPA